MSIERQKFTQIQLQLIRTIESSPASQTTCQNQGLLECMRRRFTTKPKLEEEVHRTCSVIEEVTQPISPVVDLQMNESSRRDCDIHIPFSIPVPVNIPGSETTALGSISYTILASVVAESHSVISTAHTIHLDRLVISDEPTIQHVRSYPKSKLVTQIALSQHLNTDSHSNLSFSMNVELKRPSTAGIRPSEFTCSTVRGIRCRVEEVTTLFAKSSENEPRDGDRETTIERYWGTPGNPIVEAQHGSVQADSSVDLVFNFTIPKNIKPAQVTDWSCYAFDPEHVKSDLLPTNLRECYSSTTQEKLAIIIEHRLKLDLITGEDTFDRHTKSLVDRKPLRTALNASFPLRILAKSEEDTGQAVMERVPPRYEEVPTAPPNYDPFALWPLQNDTSR
ncbi:hypothetical protein NUU61_009322 [Penicillium alfredii]|uniref:LDB19 N-terminal domain-containing protein n=1 Tax=Penicillium alfredii TaxID=1506179 RepID=A0A9W9EMT7_9EURO|nr:uncharacterized protein NUU61_009322 [Penicillium alfredii]KAJ5084743.1 hypothetical protein NUU61_009322 [Penicillium alfredii]